MNEPTDVLIVDDHPLFRRGLVDLVNTDPGLRVVAEAGDGKQGVEMFERYRPEIVLIDLNMPAMGGIEAIKEMLARNPSVLVIVLSSYEGDADIRGALAAGARGYLLKESADEEVLEAIGAVRSGRTYLSARAAGRLKEEPSARDLSARELEVLHLLARGLSNSEIADALGTKAATVKVHVRSILYKLDVSQRTEAAVVALQRGIVHLP